MDPKSLVPPGKLTTNLSLEPRILGRRRAVP